MGAPDRRADRQAAVNAIGIKRFGGAFTEAMQGCILPLWAIVAQQEMEMKAANLHIPLTPPELGAG